jgi:hypothetical protein
MQLQPRKAEISRIGNLVCDENRTGAVMARTPVPNLKVTVFVLFSCSRVGKAGYRLKGDSLCSMSEAHGLENWLDRAGKRFIDASERVASKTPESTPRSQAVSTAV